MATIVGKRSNAAKNPMQVALAEFRNHLSLAAVRDSLSASRYAVSSVDQGGAPSLVGAQVTPGTSGLPQPSSVIGTAPVAVTQSGSKFDVSLSASGVIAGTYGDATHVGKFTVDALGRITAASNVAFTSGGGSPVAVKTVTASYTVAGADVPAASAYRGAIVCNSASAVALTIDTFAHTAIPVGADITFVQEGAGAVTITAVAGVSFVAGAITGAGAGAVGRAMQIAQDVWSISGNLAWSNGGDPHWTYRTALLHFDGTNGSTTYTDEKGNTWSAVASGSSLSTAQAKFGPSSLLVNNGGITSAAVKYGGSSAWRIEFFWYTQTSGAPSATQFLAGQSGTEGIFVSANTSFAFGYYSGAGYLIDTGGTYPSANAWHYVALECDGTKVTLAVDGTVIGTTATIASSAAELYVGRDTSGDPYPWYIDELRITNGYASGDFSVPTAPFPNYGT